MEICVFVLVPLLRLARAVVPTTKTAQKNPKRPSPFHLQPGPTFFFYMYYIIWRRVARMSCWIGSVCFMNVFL